MALSPSVVWAFIAGVFTCLAIVISGAILFINWLPYYIFPVGPKIQPQRSKFQNSEWDPQLDRAGWLQISIRMLAEHDVGGPDTPTPPDQLSQWIEAAVTQSNNVASFLVSKFLGTDLNEEAVPVKEEGFPRWKTLFGVLKQKTLFLYNDESQSECFLIIPISTYAVHLLPDGVSDMELFNRYNPIALIPKEESVGAMSTFFLYCSTGSDKEDWYVLLKRVARLPEFGDARALSAFYQEFEPMKEYLEAMKKLIENTACKEDSQDWQATAWLNAIVGRIFVAIHTNDLVKSWITTRLSRGSRERDENSLLGDIVISNLSVGNSLPVISNPKLVSISIDGDMMIEMDIDYTGGVRVEAATEATLSVPAWDAYMKPITVPIVVAVKINRFAARLLLKIKPFWESNRVWFGFYHKPELKLELQVEPIISNKLIKIQLVNQVIERRIKHALEEYVMLPNMDNFSFWELRDLIGQPEDDDDESDYGETPVLLKKHSMIEYFLPENANGASSLESAANAGLSGEALESTLFNGLQRRRLKLGNRRSTLTGLIIPKQLSIATSDPAHSSESILNDFRDELDSPRSSIISDTPSNRYVEQLGQAAYSLGEMTRKFGLDKSAANVAESVAIYAQPAVTFAQKQTINYTNQLQEVAASAGIKTLERLGLGKEISEDDKNATPAIPLRSKPSLTWNVLGLKVQTQQPQDVKKGKKTALTDSNRPSPRSSKYEDQIPIIPQRDDGVVSSSAALHSEETNARD